MPIRVKYKWLGWALVALWLASGCSGVLVESKRDDGKVERVKIEGESWSSYDDKPRYYPQSRSKPLEDMSIVIKKEATF